MARIQNTSSNALSKPQQVLTAVIKVLLISHLIMFGLFLIISILLSFINPPVTSLMAYRLVFYNHKLKPLVHVPLKNIPRSFQRMIVRLEDNTFYRHIGIEPSAMRQAFKKNARLGYNMYGGSTITQQLARSLFLIPKKWLVRKYLETWLALCMDFILSKNRILELYINYVEWGPGIFGAGAAARNYYGKNLSALSKDELQRLAAVLPDPLRYTPLTLEESTGLLERYHGLTGADMAGNRASSGIMVTPPVPDLPGPGRSNSNDYNKDSLSGGSMSEGNKEHTNGINTEIEL